MNAQADEVPFLAGMEREGQVCETTIEVGKKAFQLDGVLDRLLQKARLILESRAHENGPDPGFNENDEDMRTVMRAFVDMARHTQRPNYSNGDGGSTSFQKWVLGLCSTLAVAGIVGGIAMYGRLTAIEAKIEAMQGQLSVLQRRP